MFQKWINENEQETGFNDNSVMSVRQWIIVLAVSFVPVLNFIMIIKWAFSNKEMVPANMVNWARAAIIVLIILNLAVAIIAISLWIAWRIH